MVAVASDDHVPGLLAAERAAVAPHRLEHVAVADIGHATVDARLLERPLQAEVRHRRQHDEAAGEGARGAQIARQDGEDMVAVDGAAGGVDA